MKPITYWLQNDVIDELVNDWGNHLEKLTPVTRRDIIACLASDAHYWAGDSEDIDEVWSLVEHLTRHEKDLLMAAIAANLCEQENPWLENARVNVAIAQRHAAQKTDTPAA